MAHISQYEMDMEYERRRTAGFKGIGNALSDIGNRREENRRRAIDEKRAMMREGLELAKMGATPEEVKELRDTGESSSIFSKYTDIAEKERQRRADDQKLNRDVKESTIEANRQKALENSKPFSETKEAETIKYKADIEAKKRAEEDNRKAEREAAKKNSRPVVKQQEELLKKNTNLYSVKNGMEAALVQLEDPSLSEEAKVKVGQGLLKLLNSPEGADAVGAEESKRIGGFLEYQKGNLFEPGKFIGRDMKSFTEQVRNNSIQLGDRMRRNQEGVEALSRGESLVNSSRPAAAAVPLNQQPPEVVDAKAQRLQELRAKKAQSQAAR